MEQVVLVIHLILALGIICLVLLQRSEGGGLGIGGGSGGLGGLATPGGTANALTKMTTVFAFCFFGTSLLLGILAGTHTTSRSILDEIDAVPASVTVVDDEAPVDESVPAPEERPSVPLE